MDYSHDVNRGMLPQHLMQQQHLQLQPHQHPHSPQQQYLNAVQQHPPARLQQPSPIPQNRSPLQYQQPQYGIQPNGGALPANAQNLRPQQHDLSNRGLQYFSTGYENYNSEIPDEHARLAAARAAESVFAEANTESLQYMPQSYNTQYLNDLTTNNQTSDLQQQFQIQEQLNHTTLQQSPYQEQALPQSSTSLYQGLPPASFAAQYVDPQLSQMSANPNQQMDWTTQYPQQPNHIQKASSVNTQQSPNLNGHPLSTFQLGSSTQPRLAQNVEVVIPVRKPINLRGTNFITIDDDRELSFAGYGVNADVPEATLQLSNFILPESGSTPPDGTVNTVKKASKKPSNTPSEISKRLQACIEDVNLTIKQVLVRISAEIAPYSPEGKKDAAASDTPNTNDDGQDDERKEIILKTLIDHADKDLLVSMVGVSKITGRFRSWVVDAYRKDVVHVIVRYGLMLFARMGFTVAKLQEIKLDKVLNLINKRTESEEFRKWCDMIERRAQKLSDKEAREAEAKKSKEIPVNSPAPITGTTALATSGSTNSASLTGQKRKLTDGIERDVAAKKPLVVSTIKDTTNATNLSKIAGKVEVTAEAGKLKPKISTTTKTSSGAGSFFASTTKPVSKPNETAPQSGLGFSSIFEQLKEREAAQEAAKKNTGTENPEEKVVKKKKKSVKWKDDEDLVAVQIFEVLEPEGDYYGGGSGNARQFDISEGNALKNRNLLDEDDNELEWYPPLPLELNVSDPEGPPNGYKRGGAVKIVTVESKLQEEREMKILSAHYMNISDIPYSPEEPPQPDGGIMLDTIKIPFQRDYRKGIKDMNRSVNTGPSTSAPSVPQPAPNLDVTSILSAFQQQQNIPPQPINPPSQPVQPVNTGSTNIADVLAKLTAIGKQQQVNSPPSQPAALPQPQQNQSGFGVNFPNIPFQSGEQSYPPVVNGNTVPPPPALNTDNLQALLANLSTNAAQPGGATQLPLNLPQFAIPPPPMLPPQAGSAGQPFNAAAATFLLQAMAQGGLPNMPTGAPNLSELFQQFGNIPVPPPVGPRADQNNQSNNDQWYNDNDNQNWSGNQGSRKHNRDDDYDTQNARNDQQGNNQGGNRWQGKHNKKNKNKHYQEPHPYNNANNANNAGKNQKKKICNFYAAGNCKKGPDCTFLHDEPAGGQHNQGGGGGGGGGGFGKGGKKKKNRGFGGHGGGSGSAADSAMGEDSWSGEMEY